MIWWNARIRRSIATLGLALCCAVLPTLAWAGQEKDDPNAVRVGGDIKPPARVKTVKPVYPAVARDKRVQGVVIVEATIGADGKVIVDGNHPWAGERVLFKATIADVRTAGEAEVAHGHVHGAGGHHH